MSELFLLSEHQMERIKLFSPLAHGVPRVDDSRVLSGIVYVIRNGLQWKDAPKVYGPHKTWRVLKTPLLMFPVVAISVGYDFYTGGKEGF